MNDICRILIPLVFIIFFSWLLSKLAANKEQGRKLFNKIIFWCLFLPVVGTTVGTLIMIWMHNHHLI